MKPHRTDGVSLTFALIFLTLFGWWLLAQLVHLPLPAVGWFVAGGLIFLGVLGLFGALRSGRGEAAKPEPRPEPELATVPVSGIPAELHADIVRELLNGPRLPDLPPVDAEQPTQPIQRRDAPDPTAADLPPVDAQRADTDDPTVPGLPPVDAQDRTRRPEARD